MVIMHVIQLYIYLFIYLFIAMCVLLCILLLIIGVTKYLFIFREVLINTSQVYLVFFNTRVWKSSWTELAIQMNLARI